MGKASRKTKQKKTERKTPSCENGIWRFLQKSILHILLITTVGLLAYSNTFNVPFQFDDSHAIVNNPIIKDLNYFVDPSGVKGLILDNFDIYKALKARYIGFVTLALNYSVHGLDVTGYHVVNLTIHIINALLVYYLIVLTFRTPALRRSSLRDRSWFIAALSALLFVSHPIQTQAVTYIVGRLASLTTLFYLLSIVMYIKARTSEDEVFSEERTKIKFIPIFYYLISITSAVLAMKTKEIAFTLPVIIVIYDFIFLEGSKKRRILYLIPLLLTMLIIPVNLIGFDKPLGEVIADITGETQFQKSISRSEYFFTQLRVIVTYIRLLFLPINQNLDYDYPIYHSLFDPEVFLSFIFLLSVIGSGVYVMYRYRNTIPHTRLMAFGIFWFFITPAVESSIVLHVIYEHRVYLPSVGFVLVCVTGLAMLMERANSKMVIRVIVAGVITVVVILGGATYGRNRIWQNEITLWEDVVLKSPEKSRPHLSMGNIYFRQNRIDKALLEYQTALKFKPDSSDANNNLGNTYVKQGRFVEAISAYKTAIQFNPDNVAAYYNLGIAYVNQNLYDEAISAYKTAIQFRPDYADAYNNLGVSYAKQNRLDEAISAYKTALLFKPDHAAALKNLKFYENLKLYYEAIKIDEMIEQ
jgi:tetratricopeptide (TPR) repeat protein